MLIQKLTLSDFGKFHNYEIALKPGLTIVYGENESGKSTIHTFVKGMLFGVERLRGRAAATKGDLYMRYLPWEYPGAFRGSMDIIVREREYRIQRNMYTSDKSFQIIDLQNAREIPLANNHISDLIPD